MYYFYNSRTIGDKTPVKAVNVNSDMKAILYAEENLEKLLDGTTSLYLYSKQQVLYCCILEGGTYVETYSVANSNILVAAKEFANVIQNSYVLPTCAFGSRLRSIYLYEREEDSIYADISVLKSSKSFDKTIDFARLIKDSTTINKSYLKLLNGIITAVPWNINSIAIPRVSFKETNYGDEARVGAQVRFNRHIKDEGWSVRI